MNDDTEATRQQAIVAGLEKVRRGLCEGAHFPRVSDLTAQLNALRYLVDNTPQTVRSWTVREGIAAYPDLLRRLQDGFNKARPDTRGTVPGHDGEPVDICTVKEAQDRVVYQDGVRDALDWMLSNLSHVAVHEETGGVVRLEGYLR